MGYFSEVVLTVRNHLYDDLTAIQPIKNLLSYADTHITVEEGHLFHWQSIKWYSDFKDVGELKNLLCNADDDYFCMIIGQEWGDKEDYGSWWDNPFDVCWKQSISFLEVDDDNEILIPKELLQIKNSKEGATHCAQCGKPLKNPMPGIKFCPVCEP